MNIAIKSFLVNSNYPDAKLARLSYDHILDTNNYHLYKIVLFTGRHHQIRVQLSSRGVHIKGDVKYGAKRANDDKSISLHAFSLTFEHPVSNKMISVRDWPIIKSDSEIKLWNYIKSELSSNSFYCATQCESV